MISMADDMGGRVDQSLPIAPQIGRILRDRIIRNELKPGHKLSEAHIASTYGVSRQPVREAFIRLNGEGLISVRPSRGTSVRRIHVADVRDAQFLREAIESDIVRLLARTPDPAALGELRRQIDRQHASRDADPLAFMAVDDHFHRSLAAAAGKAGIWRKVQGLKSQMDRVRYLSLAEFPMRKLVDQHAQLLERIAAGDAVGAETCLRNHLREVLKDLPGIVHGNPQFFDVPPDMAVDGTVHI